MKKNALIVVVVLAIALCLYYFFMRPAPKLAEQPGTAPSQEEFAAPPPVAAESTDETKSGEETSAKKLPPPLNTVPSGTAPRQVDIIVDDQILKEMENKWDDLRREVNLREETEGFRVSYLDKGSVFVKTGLQEGDLIRYEQIYDMKKNAKSMDEKRIVDRLIKILNHVDIDENN